MSSVGGRRPFRGLGRMLAALMRQRRRLALATVAIALGVGYLAGALTLLDRVSGGLDALAAAGAERADLVVEGGVAYESPVEQVRRLVPITVGQGLDSIPGVASVSPRIEDVAVLIGPNGTPLVAPGLSEQPLGANWPNDSAIAPYRFASGGPPAADRDVVIDQRSAERAGFKVGDTVSISGKSKVGQYTVSGIIRTDAGGLPAGSSLALFTTAEARALFDRPLDDNAVAVRLTPGADRAEVEGAIRRTLPSGIEIVDGPTAAVHRQESLTRSFTLVKSLILAFAALALFVGMVTVANSLALLYGERRRTFAALRLVGAKPRQLMTAALVEAGLLALVASLLGVPLGLLLGRLIEAALGALNTSVPVAGSIVSWRALVLAMAIGIVATVVAALIPAARACRVPPIEAVTDAAVDRPNHLRRTLLVVAVVAVLAGALTAVLVLRGGGSDSLVATSAAVGGGVALIGLMPVILSALVAGGVRLVPVRPRALVRIASRDVVRNRTRTAATAAALIVATAVVAGLAVFLASFTASVDAEVKDLVTADLVVDSGTFTRGGLPADLLEQIASLDDVQATSGWEVGRANVGLTPLRLTGLDLGSLYDVLSPVWVGSPPTNLDASSILLSSATADTLGVKVGDPLPVTFTSGGTETLRVDGVYDSGTLLLGEAVLDRSVLQRQIPATTDIAALVTLDPDNAVARKQVTDLAASYGVTSVLRPAQFVDRRSDLLRGFQRVIEWMLLFTLVQALVGVVNTLLLSVGERRREFGLLRASGASRRQVLRLVLLEGISLAVVGTAFGLALGVVGARLGIGALSSLGLKSFVIPVGTVVLTGVAAVLLGVAAAVVPARWAAGVPPLEAVSDAGMLRSRPRRDQRPRFFRRGRAAFHWDGAPVAATATTTAAAVVAAPMVPPPFPAASPTPVVPTLPPLVPPPLPVAPVAPVLPVAPVVAAASVLGATDQWAMPFAQEVPPPAPAAVAPMPFAAAVDREASVAEPGPSVPLFTPVGDAPGAPAAPPAPPVPPVDRPPLFAGSPVAPATEPVSTPEPVVVVPSAPPAAEPVPVPEPIVAPEPVVLPEPEPAVAFIPVEPEPLAPVRRGRRVSRLMADSSRRRRERTSSSGSAAEGWLTPEEEPAATATFAPVDDPAPGVAAAVAGAGLRFGTGDEPPPPAPDGRAGGGAGRGSSGGRPQEPAPDRATGSGGGDNLADVVGRLHRASVEEGAPALALLGGVLAPGERVDHLVQGRAKGLVCVVARTDRRIVVVADRPQRPLVESLHPTRTKVRLAPGDGDRLRMAVADGSRVLQLTGIRDADEAAGLAGPARPDPGYF